MDKNLLVQLASGKLIRYGAYETYKKHNPDEDNTIVAVFEETGQDSCVACGEYVPEGRMVCKQCSEK